MQQLDCMQLPISILYPYVFFLFATKTIYEPNSNTNVIIKTTTDKNIAILSSFLFYITLFYHDLEKF